MTNTNNCCDPIDYVQDFIPLKNCKELDEGGPIAPTPTDPPCPDGYIQDCKCIEDPRLTPCPDGYQRNPESGFCEYIYPWTDPGDEDGTTTIIYPIPDSVLPYEIKYTVKARVVQVSGSGCRGWDGGAGRGSFEIQNNVTILGYGSTTYEISKSERRTSRMFCRGQNGETFGRTQIQGPGSDDFNPYPKYPLIKLYAKDSDLRYFMAMDSSTWGDWWYPDYGDRTHSNYGCNTANADPPECWRAYFLTPRVTVVDVTYVKVEISGGDNNIEDGRLDKEWAVPADDAFVGNLLMA